MTTTGVSSAIVRFLKPVIWRKLGLELWVMGKLQRTASVDTSVDLASFPMTAKDLKFQEQGSYTTEDRKYYQIGNTYSISEKDEIIENGLNYSITQVTDRMDHGGFIFYLSKKVQK